MVDTKALENAQECFECDCYLYCTMDSCILDIEDEPQEFEFTDIEVFMKLAKSQSRMKND